MKVKDLLAILCGLDPEANVLVASQPSYPMEYALSGVAVRSDFSNVDDVGDDEAPATRPSDVLLLEGSHLRYGARAAWDHARR